jgi:hypothetical protein
MPSDEATSKQQRVSGALAKETPHVRGELTNRVKCHAVHFRDSGLSLSTVCEKIYARYGVRLENSQIVRYMKSRDAIEDAFLSSPSGKRTSGGGRPRVYEVGEAATVEEIKKRRANSERVTASDVAEILRVKAGVDENPSQRQVETLVAREGLAKKKANIRTPLTDEQLKKLIDGFLTRSAGLSNLIVNSVDEIVQFDECAGTLSGNMRDSTSTITTRDDTDVKVRVSALDDHRKFATIVVFAATGEPIPPIVVFKGKKRYEGENLELEYAMSEGGNVTEEVMIGTILPHIFKHRPRAKLLVFDHANSHHTAQVERDLKARGVCALQIPPKCTSFLQYLDIFFFSRYRAMHNRLAVELAQKHGEKVMRLTQSEKRHWFCYLVNRAVRFMLEEADPKQRFIELGYFKPTAESVHLPRNPDFTFTPPELLNLSDCVLLRSKTRAETKQARKEAEIQAALVKSETLPVGNAAVREAERRKRYAEEQATLDKWTSPHKPDLSQIKTPPRTRAPRVCTCGKPARSRGRHKDDCAMARRVVGEKASRDDAETEAPQAEEWCHARPGSQDLLEEDSLDLSWFMPATQEDKDQARREMDVPSLSQHDLNEAVMASQFVPEAVCLERRFLDAGAPNEMMVHTLVDYALQDMISQAQAAGAMIPNVDLFSIHEAWLSTQSRGTRDIRDKAMTLLPMCFGSHFILVVADLRADPCVTWYDSIKGTNAQREVRVRAIVGLVVKKRPNESVATVEGQCPEQVRGSNDCGLHVVNNATKVATGREGLWSRLQLRERAANWDEVNQKCESFVYFEK